MENLNENSENPPDNALPTDPSASALTNTFVCPHCEAELKNVRAEPGQALRCLNCGKRFVPVPALELSVETSTDGTRPNIDGTSVAQRRELPARDVKTPGYWLLRIPAILFCAAGFVIGAMMLVSMLMAPGALGKFNILMLFYIPLWPIGGLFAFWLTRALARIDASMAKALECRRRNASDLPSVSGSSLPYILPMAVFGGAVPILSLSATGARGDQDWVTISSTGVGFIIFFAAFALEDVRQFLWRQQEYCLRFSGIEGKPPTHAKLKIGTSSLALTIGTLGMGMLLTTLTIGGRDNTIMVMALGYIGIAYSLGRLDGEFTGGVAQWLRYRRGSYDERICDEVRVPGVNEPWLILNSRFALCTLAMAGLLLLAISMSFSNTNNGIPHDKFIANVYALFIVAPLSGIALSLISRRARISNTGFILSGLSILPLITILGTWVYWLIALLLGEERIYNEQQFIAMGMAGCGLLFFTLWMNEIMTRVNLWREALTAFPLAGTSESILKGYQSLFLKVVAGLVLAQALLFSLMFLDEVRSGSSFLGLLVVLVLAHAPTAWLAMLLREVWHVERVVTRDVTEEAGV